MPAMLARTLSLIVLALAASAAEQDVERTFQAAHAATAQDLQEITMTVRAVANIPRIAVDEAQRTVAVRGTPAQVAVAEWLFGALDRPAGAAPAAEYRAGDDDVVGVFYLVHAATPRDLQEIATSVRSVADIGRLFVCSTPKAVAVRTTAARAALAEWLIHQLDVPTGVQRPATDEYRLAGANDDVTRVFYPAQAATPQDLQELVTTVRTIADVQRIFTYNSPMAISARGTAAQLALTAWLVGELDRPAGTPRTAPPAYCVPGSDDVVRVFYFAQAANANEMQETASRIRGAAQIRRIFVCSAPKAVAMRGTAAQMAQAEQVIQKRDKPAAP